MFPALLYVAGGGAAGSVLRYLLIDVVGRIMGPSSFAYGTFIANITGSFFLGLWIGALPMLGERAANLHLLVAVGVLGGFTTFSTFSNDLFGLVQSGLYVQAAMYALGSVLLSLAGLAFGLWVMKLAGI